MDIEKLKKDCDRREIVAWRDLADSDYIASRMLLRNGFLLQGAILANSAIEKYLKAVLRIVGISFMTQGEKAHDLINLCKKLKKFDEKVNINESYLNLLNKAYKLRYPDRIKEEYNIALSQVKTLVGLDETVFKIRKHINITGNEREFKFDVLLKEKNEPLLQGNHTFGKTKRNELFKKPLLWYEMRKLKYGNWMEASYLGMAQDDGKYNLEGLKHGLSEREYKLQTEPFGLK